MQTRKLILGISLILVSSIAFGVQDSGEVVQKLWVWWLELRSLIKKPCSFFVFFSKKLMVVMGISLLLIVPFVLGMVPEPLVVNINFLNIFLLLFTANAVALKRTSARSSMRVRKVAKFYLMSWAPMALIIVIVLASVTAPHPLGEASNFLGHC